MNKLFGKTLGIVGAVSAASASVHADLNTTFGVERPEGRQVAIIDGNGQIVRVVSEQEYSRERKRKEEIQRALETSALLTGIGLTIAVRRASRR